MVPKLNARVVLSGPDNIETVGTDYVTDADAGGDMNQPTVVGNREFDVQVRVISRSQAGNKTAQYYLEKIRAALTRPSTIETFVAAGIAVFRMGKGVRFDAPFEERWESIAAATWRVSTTIADSEDTAQDTIQSVDMTQNVEHPDGTVVTRSVTIPE